MFTLTLVSTCAGYVATDMNPTPLDSFGSCSLTLPLRGRGQRFGNSGACRMAGGIVVWSADRHEGDVDVDVDRVAQLQRAEEGGIRLDSPLALHHLGGSSQLRFTG